MSLKQNDIVAENLKEMHEECMYCGSANLSMSDANDKLLCEECNSVQVELPDYEPEA